MPRRIVVETSVAQKESLDLFLQETGSTLTDWFSDRVAEATAAYVPAPHESDSSLRNLQDLSDSAKVYNSLKAVDWAFTDDETGYLSHNLHPYPAKFIPQIPRNLIMRLSLPGELVWDPFGGSGTTALEALLEGRRAISSDLNPIANVIGQAKTVSLTADDHKVLTHLIARLDLLGRDGATVDQTIRRQWPELQSLVPSIPNVDKWFHPNAIRELAYLRHLIERLTTEPTRALARAAFSKIILKASFQDNETRYASKVRHVIVGSIIRMFAAELDSARAKTRGTSALLGLRTACFRTADARHDPIVPPASVDLIVTSPPYPNATDYHLYHRFRLYWLGFSPQEVGKHEIGSHLRHQKEESGISQYVQEMTLSLHRMFDGLRPARYAVLVVGDAVFSAHTHSTADLLADSATKLGFELVGCIDRPVHSTRRSFISAARRLRTEQILILRRPSRSMVFQLEQPNYRLWPYEEHLRTLEVTQLLGCRIRRFGNGILKVRTTSLSADRLRHLTFTHSFCAAEFAKERTWQAILENGDASEKQRRKDPKYATHGLHNYKGKFYPQLTKSLFNIACLRPGDVILDPFCGSGTALVEAKLNGISSKGMDLNPLAAMISAAKVRILNSDPIVVDRLLGDFLQTLTIAEETDIEGLFDTECLSELKSWFPLPVLRRLARIIGIIDEIPEQAVRELLTICLSNIVRDISQQDPKDLRIRRRKKPLTDAPVANLLADEVIEQRNRLRHFAEQAGRCPTGFGAAEVFHADSRLWDSFVAAGLDKCPVDAVVTSPPYATALPYIDTDRLSLLLLLGMRGRERARIEYSLTGSREINGGERVDIEKLITGNSFEGIMSSAAKKTVRRVFLLNRNANVGFRRKNQGALLYRYYRDLTMVMTHLGRAVRPGGSLFFVIGDNFTEAGGRPIRIPSAEVIRETGELLGWELIETIPITVTKEARPHHRHSITRNDIIWMRRPL